MDRIERWITQKLASAVAAGIGQWDDSPGASLGKRIYSVTDGQVTLVLSQMGLMYDGPSSHFECRYDDVEVIKIPRLADIMRLRGDLSKMLTIEINLRGVPVRLDLQLPLRVYSQIATVLTRIVNEMV